MMDVIFFDWIDNTKINKILTTSHKTVKKS